MNKKAVFSVLCTLCLLFLLASCSARRSYADAVEKTDLTDNLQAVSAKMTEFAAAFEYMSQNGATRQAIEEVHTLAGDCAPLLDELDRTAASLAPGDKSLAVTHQKLLDGIASYRALVTAFDSMADLLGPASDGGTGENASQALSELQNKASEHLADAIQSIGAWQTAVSGQA